MKRTILILLTFISINNSYAQTINIQTLLSLGNKPMQEISEYLMKNKWVLVGNEKDDSPPMQGDYANFPCCLVMSTSADNREKFPGFTLDKDKGVFRAIYKKPKEYLIIYWYSRGAEDPKQYTQGIAYKTANNSPAENIKYLKSHGYLLSDASSGGFLSYDRKDSKESVVISQIENSNWLGYYIDLCGKYCHFVK